MEPVMARKMWRTLEPYHGLIYFAPEAASAYEALGVTGRDGYFASRAAAMGAVPAEVVIATFFNFNPDLVRHAIPAAWEAASPHQLVEARAGAADAALRRALGDVVDGAEVARAAELARVAADGCSPVGRALYAGQSSLPWPTAPHVALWHAISLLREHRGDGHIAALVDARLSGLDALIFHAASGDVPRVALQTSRGWPDEAWDAAVARLVDRGLVDAEGGFTDDGAALRQHIEDRTDALALAPWQGLGEDGCDELRGLVRPLSKAIVEGGTFGFRPSA
ncbi:MAG: SCO6745 family protein [Acidimicrobiales bacterium]